MKSHQTRDIVVVEALYDHQAEDYGSLDPDQLNLVLKFFLILDEWDSLGTILSLNAMKAPTLPDPEVCK